MACKPICKLCRHLVISQTIAFTGGDVVINLPAGTYEDGEKYCIVTAQDIPDTATINAPVVAIINGGTTIYPLVNCDGSAVTASAIRTRTRYSTHFVTTATGGAFNLIGKVRDGNRLASVNS